jgi:hypothetical protein
MDEILVGPDAADDVEGFEEHLARVLLVDAEGLEFGRTQATAEAHVEAPIGRLSSIDVSSATSSGCRNGRMLTMLLKRMRRVVRAAAAINKLGDGTGAVG